jgi:hypothetical protein
LTIRNIWHGYTNTDWNTASNWSDNAVPSQASCDSVIILKTSNQPIIAASSMGSVNHLKMRPGATLQVLGTLQVAGSITDDNMAIDATKGTIDLNGNKELYKPTQQRVMQTIAGHMFNTPYTNNSGRLLNLQISSPNSATVAPLSALNDTLNITGSLSFGDVNNAILHTGNNITLISDANGTARVADITNNTKNSGNTFDGWVEVERFLRTGSGANEHLSSWQFLATPTVGQTVRQSWQENATSPPPTAYGTWLTDPAGTGAGFDASSPFYSMKWYKPGASINPTSPDWYTVTTTSQAIYNPSGYMVYVGGDRNVVGPFYDGANITRMRTKGNLLINRVTLNAPANSFISVGNPYASQIDMRKVMADRIGDANGGVSETFYTWNSPGFGTYGIGSYIDYVLVDGNWVSTPGGQTNNNIESGQAFFVQTTCTDGKMDFNETSKSSGFNNTVFRTTGQKIADIRTNLYTINKKGIPLLTDGIFIQFDNQFSNKIDGLDARKMLGGGLNLSIRKDSKLLIVERMRIPSSQDTVFMNLRAATAANYRFEFVARNWAEKGVKAYIEDHYLNTVTPINMDDTSIIDFKVESAKASYAPDRFDIIFEPEVILPVKITSIEANQKGKDIEVNWTVVNEKNAVAYDVERSTDGVQFVRVASVPAVSTGTGNYSWIDQDVLAGYYYYRIKSIDNKGNEQYSKTVKVLIGTDKPTISIYPNPITNGVINLQLLNMPAGKYGIRLMNQLGQIIVSKQVVRMNGSSTERIQWNYNLSHGIYHLEVILPTGEVKMIKVLY